VETIKMGKNKKKSLKNYFLLLLLRGVKVENEKKIKVKNDDQKM